MGRRYQVWRVRDMEWLGQLAGAVRTETVRAVHRCGGGLACSQEPRDDLVRVVQITSNHLAVVIRRDATPDESTL